MEVGDVVYCRRQPAVVLKRDRNDKNFEWLIRLKDKTLAWVPRKAITNTGASK